MQQAHAPAQRSSAHHTAVTARRGGGTIICTTATTTTSTTTTATYFYHYCCYRVYLQRQHGEAARGHVDRERDERGWLVAAAWYRGDDQVTLQAPPGGSVRECRCAVALTRSHYKPGGQGCRAVALPRRPFKPRAPPQQWSHPQLVPTHSRNVRRSAPSVPISSCHSGAAHTTRDASASSAATARPPSTPPPAVSPPTAVSAAAGGPSSSSAGRRIASTCCPSPSAVRSTSSACRSSAAPGLQKAWGFRLGPL